MGELNYALVTIPPLVWNGQCVGAGTAIGVSIDAEKFVWLIDQEGWAWKIDPENVGAMKMMPVAGSHYVYSDMSGGQILSVLPQ